jgi:hypothetical protein
MNETDNLTSSSTDSIATEDGQCGYLNYEKFDIIQNCGFWVEGVAMAIFGFSAIVTSAISIYVYTR